MSNNFHIYRYIYINLLITYYDIVTRDTEISGLVAMNFVNAYRRRYCCRLSSHAFPRLRKKQPIRRGERWRRRRFAIFIRAFSFPLYFSGAATPRRDSVRNSRRIVFFHERNNVRAPHAIARRHSSFRPRICLPTKNRQYSCRLMFFCSPKLLLLRRRRARQREKGNE